MAFTVGQKVVCVDVGDTPNSLNGSLALRGVYVVRSVEVCSTGRPGVRLVGYEYSCKPYQRGLTTGICFVDAALWQGRFRPIVERKTDISIFTAMLTPSKETIDVMNRESV